MKKQSLYEKLEKLRNATSQYFTTFLIRGKSVYYPTAHCTLLQGGGQNYFFEINFFGLDVKF